jgi:hypothetical protein
MNLKLAFFILISFSTIALAQKGATATLPFATYEINIPLIKAEAIGSIKSVVPVAQVAVKTKITNELPVEQMADLIKKIRVDLCKTIAPGSVEVWIGVGAGSSAIIVNSHIDTGIKVSFSCNKPTKDE